MKESQRDFSYPGKDWVGQLRLDHLLLGCGPSYLTLTQKKVCFILFPIIVARLAVISGREPIRQEIWDTLYIHTMYLHKVARVSNKLIINGYVNFFGEKSKIVYFV